MLIMTVRLSNRRKKIRRRLGGFKKSDLFLCCTFPKIIKTEMIKTDGLFYCHSAIISSFSVTEGYDVMSNHRTLEQQHPPPSPSKKL